jgi:hypothetical protein
MEVLGYPHIRPKREIRKKITMILAESLWLHTSVRKILPKVDSLES